MFTHILIGVLAFIPSLVAGSLATSGTVYVTPHSQFSSSIGVLGCKVDTNRIAYWPVWPDWYVPSCFPSTKRP